MSSSVEPQPSCHGAPKANVRFAETDLLTLHETGTAFQVPVNALVALETTSEGPHATAQFESLAPKRKTGHHCPPGCSVIQ